MTDETEHRVYLFVNEEGTVEDLAFDVEVREDELPEDQFLEEEFEVRPAELTADQKEQLETAIGGEWGDDSHGGRGGSRVSQGRSSDDAAERDVRPS